MGYATKMGGNLDIWTFHHGNHDEDLWTAWVLVKQFLIYFIISFSCFFFCFVFFRSQKTRNNCFFFHRVFSPTKKSSAGVGNLASFNSFSSAVRKTHRRMSCRGWKTLRPPRFGISVVDAFSVSCFGWWRNPGKERTVRNSGHWGSLRYSSETTCLEKSINIGITVIGSSSHLFYQK